MSKKRFKKRGQNRGMPIFLVVSVLSLLFLSAAGLFFMTHRSSFEGKKGLLEFRMNGLLLSIQRGMHQQLLLKVRSGEQLNEGMEIPYDTFKSLSTLTSPFGMGLKIRASTRIEKIQPLAKGFGIARHPGEKELQVLWKIELSYRKINRSLFLSEGLRLVLPTDPILAHFTLFTHQIDNPNLLEHDYHQIKGKRKPLYLIHHPQDLLTPVSLPRKNWQGRGWVYPGAFEMEFKKTGMHPKNLESELFHFKEPGKGIAAYIDKKTPQKPIKVFRSLFGFSQDMDFQEGLFSGAKITKEGKKGKLSSALHLFGHKEAPSPTLVYGQAYSLYTRIGILELDLDGNGKTHGVANLNGQPGESEKIILPFLKSYHFPDHLPKCPQGWKNPLGHGNLGSLFSGFNNGTRPYSTFSTTLIREPVNKTLDYMLYQGVFPPTPVSPGLLSDQKTTLNFPSGENFFSGPLKDYKAHRMALSRVTLTVSNAGEFRKKFLRGDELHLRGEVVLIKKGHLALPKNLEIQSGGMVILLQGNIGFNRIRKGGHQILPLTLMTLEGDLIVPQTGVKNPEDCQVFLAAPRGKIRFRNPSTPLNIMGGLLVEKFSMAENQSGGTILFDPYFLENPPPLALSIHAEPLSVDFNHYAGQEI